METRWEGETASSWERAWGIPLVEVHESIGSTSDRAFELAAEGAGPFTVVVAGEQTRGRGRRGASWHSAPGAGLWMSALLPPRAAPRWLPLLVGLVVAEAVESATGAVGVRIKWPNDLVLGLKKVGGILCESAGTVVVAGIGINLRAPPGGFPGQLADTATSLEMEGAKSLSPSRLAGAIVGGLKGRIEPDLEALGPATLAALEARDVLRGRSVRTEAGPGTARGFAADGALLLERTDGSRVPVASGSVRIV